MFLEEAVQVQPLEGRPAQQSVIEVVPVDVDDGFQIGALDVTKPAEAGLSPQEQLAIPAGHGVSRASTLTHRVTLFNTNSHVITR